jgi:flagellin
MAQADFTRIATNIGALNALASLRTINSKLGVHQQRLSTGKRINSAADDPAGLTIATKMLARSEGLKVALDNIGDAKNMLSVAEAGLGKLTDILVTMRSKAEQAASDTLGASERAAIQAQLQSYAEQIDNVVSETKWNGVKLLDGTVNKRFQTGADEGEYTTWQLSQEHTAKQLGVAETYTTAGVGNKTTSASLTDVAVATAFTGLTEIPTGSSYRFEVLDKAASATVGKTNVAGAYIGGLSSMAASTPAGGELSSGWYTLQITDATANSVDYVIKDASGNAIYSVADADWSAGGTVQLTNGTSNIGIQVSVNPGTLATGSMEFEYINSGQVKIALKDSSGQAMVVDADGVSGGATNTYAYVDAGGTYNSGRGVNVTIAAIGSVVTGNTITFDYHQSGNWVVDVSTAVKAGQYMTKVNTALDTVNSSMADLGSLMARLTFKEDAVSVAQVNVEASYNRIMNADMAFEQLEATKMSILQQTAITMLAQANTSPQAILGLFR